MISNLISRAHVWALSKRYELAAEDGQGTIEYMAVAGIVVVGIIAALTLTNIGTFFTNMITNVTNAELGG